MADATMRITTRRLDGQRRLVSDIVRLSNRVPIFPVDRIMALSELEAVRREALPRIGWSAVFMKAYAIVARDRPALRSWYVPWRILTPWRRPRWATSPVSVASLAISRPRDPNGPHADPADVALDPEALWWARLREPVRSPSSRRRSTAMPRRRSRRSLPGNSSSSVCLARSAASFSAGMPTLHR
jgi:hypothetical protein